MLFIIATIKPGDIGPAVANLQDALLTLLEHQIIRALDAPNRPTREELQKLADGLKAERVQSIFGDATRQLIMHFQVQEGLGDNLLGVVEESTAAKLNGELKKIDPLHEVFNPHGVVRDSTGTPGKHLSEFELLAQVILSLLKGRSPDGEDLSIESLQPSDSQSLAKKTGEPVERIDWLITATKLSRAISDSGIESGKHAEDNYASSIPGAAFYGWLRKGHPDNITALRQQAPSALRRSLLEAVDESLVPAMLKKDVDLIIASLDNPEWKAVKEFIQAVGFNSTEQTLLGQHFDQLDAIKDIALSGLIQAAVLTDAQASQLGLAASVQRLIQGPVNLLGPLLETSPTQLGRPLASSEDLARLSIQDWVSLLTTAGVTPPSDQTVEAYASDLEEIAVSAYPTVGLLYRSARVPQTLETHFQEIQPRTEVLKKLSEFSVNDTAVSEVFEMLSPEQQRAVLEIQQYVNSHPGLDAELPIAKLQEASFVWAGHMSKLIETNADQDLLALDYSVLASEPIALDFGDLPREPLLRELKSLQRMLTVAESPTGAQVLMRAGLYSASQMALLSRETIVEKTGLDEAEVTVLHDRAKAQSDQVALTYFAGRDATRTQRILTGAAQIGESKQLEALRSQRILMGAAQIGENKQLEALRKLFGNLDACECAHCLSVLSPAAYFVDLMHYVERYISTPQDANRTLKARRADLWELPLSCDNTHTIVPTLDIVNRVLETWLKQKLNLNSSVELFNEIATLGASRFTLGFKPTFSLPTNFPLQRLEILLSHFGLSRDRVAQALGWTTDDRIHTRLQLTADERTLITSPLTTNLSAAVSYFENLYGITSGLSQLDANALLVRGYNLSQLQRITKIDRDVLRTLVLSHFVSADGSTNPVITMKLVASTGAVQNNLEMIHGLSVRRLDRLHRLIRLWRVLPWTVTELDYVLKRLAAQRTLQPVNITIEVLGDIVSLLDLADRTRLPVDELMSLVGPLPEVGLRGDESLFNRRFNTQPFVARDGVWPTDLPAQLKHPAFAPDEGVSTPDKNTLARLLAALQIDNAQFLELVNGLASATVATNEALKKQVSAGRFVIRLTPLSLQLLYRHARLAHLLGVKASVLLRLMALTPELNSKPANKQFVETMPDLMALLRFADAQKASGYSLEKIDWLLNPARVPTDTKPAAEIAHSVVQTIAKERRLIISSKTLTTAGLTELESTQAIQKLNESILETFGSTDEHRLRSEIEMSEIQPLVFSKLSASLDFDVAESAILSLAKHLGEFEDTAFSAPLYMGDINSKQIVTDNLVSITKPKNAFIKIRDEDLTKTPVQRARYRINPAFDQTLSANRLQNIASGLADKMVRESLKAMYMAGSAKVLAETLFQKIFLTEQQSRWLAAANTGAAPALVRPLTPSSSADGLLLNPDFFAAINAPPLVLTKLVTTPISAQLGLYHWQTVFDEVLAREFVIPVGRVTEFRSYDFPANTTAIARALQGLTTDLSPLTQWVAQTQRLQCLLNNPIFDVTACHLVLSTWPKVTAQTTQQILWNHILSVSAYARWLKVTGTNTPAGVLRRAAIERLLRSQTNQDLAEQDVADALAISIDEIKSAKPITPSRTVWHQQLDQWALILEITARLGVSGETINRLRPKTLSKTVGAHTIVIEDIDSLWRAADDIHAAFRAKYFDVAVFNEKSEAFEDLIRGKRRDALVAFLVSQYAFQGPSQLYAYYLLDVEVSGCARTSELVSATMCLQLYVHRVLLGLEISDSNSFVKYTSEEARREWAWRKHYRVWEANRKVFLYPENFIEPDLRDDKTPLFNELESELLQRQITTAEAQESYAKYLTGYGELAGLKIVGAFNDMETDVLHLVGVTESDPPIHYLRQVKNILPNVYGASKPSQFMPWEKLSVQIPVKWVSPVVFQRKLMLFWTEITTVSSTRKIDDKNYFDGYEHKFKVKCVERKSDASWSSAQEFMFLDPAGQTKTACVDPLVPYLPPPDPRFYSWDIRTTLTRLDKDQSQVMVAVWDNKENKAAGDTSGAMIPDSQFGVAIHHGSPKEQFKLTGWNWERVFPTVRYTGQVPSEVLQIAAMNSSVHGFMPVGERRVPFTHYTAIQSGLNNLLSAHWMYSFFRNANELRTSGSNTIEPVGHHVWRSTGDLLTEKSSGTLIARFSTNITDGLVVNSRALVSTPGNNAAPFSASAILHAGASQVLAVNSAHPYLVTLSSSLAKPILMQLAAQSIPSVLNLTFEKTLNEAEPLSDRSIAAKFGAGAFGAYLRETFFHIPFLIANHLNSQQRFAESQQWYHYIFNPMNAEKPWQYREFDGHSVESMREALTDPVALAAYRQDPFNPHAIARTRLSAYQKSIAMKYIDNLLDWGDKLFSQFTMESVNEATMLYVLAYDVLGERPAKLPRCADEKPRTYAQIKPSLSDISDFLIEEIEQITIRPDKPRGTGKTILPPRPGMTTLFSAVSPSSTPSSRGMGMGNKMGGFSERASFEGTTMWTSTAGTPISDLRLGNKQIRVELNTIGPHSARVIGGDIDFVPGGTPVGQELFFKEPHIDIPGLTGVGTTIRPLDIGYTLDDVPPPHREVHHREPPKVELIELVSATSVFCFPQNEELLAYWNRVEDRLFKVRNCMDIAGVRRRLDLFAPEIDPRLLVRMKAAGLSLEDVLDVTTGHAPPYRFAFLLEKARQYASAVQTLGGQVLSALEKKDAEELAAMRSVHEQQLLEMRTQLMRWEIDASNDALDGLTKQKEAAEYRKEHYDSLIANGLSGWEHAQSAATISATSLSSLSAVHDIAAAIASFVPQLHSPTIVGATAETGGKAVSEALARISSSLKTSAGIADRVAGLAGLEGGFQRRSEEWGHQAQLVDHELKQIDKQIEAAEIRVLIAERSFESHEKSIAQSREVYDFYRNKFSNLGLYTWMSTNLHRMHRLAFNTAWSMSRMAEKALHFERPDLRDSVKLGAPAWDAGRAGLLAGEALLLELQRMEMRHLETNYRELEVEQAFSLAQFGAVQLLELQSKGECEFNIPEFFFDLHYPGQYLRRIKAVRLTLPCVAGPYGNVGATLTLIKSELRDRPQANAALKPVPLRHAPTIAASSAQNDAGVFEFSFRDERYMPFEGMGAISTWKLSLPKNVRSFDYGTISDVILRINYTALEDGTLRDDMESVNGKMLARFKEAAPVRIFSMRHDFPTVWAQFKSAQPNASQRCELKLSLRPEHFPFWASTLTSQDNPEASVLIDSSSSSDIIIYKKDLAPPLPVPPDITPATEQTDVVPVGDHGGFHSGPISVTGPNSVVGDWVVYFKSDDRSTMRDLWLVMPI